MRFYLRKMRETEGQPTENYCINCMNPLQPGDAVCPRCGSRPGPKQRGSRLLTGLIATAAVLCLVLIGILALLLMKEKTNASPQADAKPTVAPVEADGGAKEAFLFGEETVPPETEAASHGVESLIGRNEVFMNELEPAHVEGKLWTRSEAPVPAGAHTNANAPACWSDKVTRGHTSGEVWDAQGKKYTYGISVDAKDGGKYTITYDLNGDYTSFSGYVGCPAADSLISTTITNDQTKQFYIWLDGEEKVVCGSTGPLTGSFFFNISVEGVRTLMIGYKDTSYPNELATLFDGKLTK